MPISLSRQEDRSSNSNHLVVAGSIFHRKILAAVIFQNSLSRCLADKAAAVAAGRLSTVGGIMNQR